MEEEDAPQGVEQAAPDVQESEAQTEEETEGKKEQADSAEPEEQSDDKPRKRGVEKRIDELTKNWRSAERDRDYWRQLALRTQQEPESVSKPEPPQGKPTPEQFNYDQDAYQEALMDWKVEQRIQKIEAERSKQTEAQKAQQRAQEFSATLQKAAGKYEDFQEVISDPSLPIPQHVVDSAMELGEAAGDVLYHLAKDPARAAEIAEMSPYRAAIALGRIEAQLTAKPPAQPQLTKAPPPPPVVGNRVAVRKDPEKMSMDEWMRDRNKSLYG